MNCRHCDVPLTRRPGAGKQREFCDIACRQAHHVKPPKPRKRSQIGKNNSEVAKLGEALLTSLRSVPCLDCGGSFPTICMDFDHLPGFVKLFALSRWRNFTYEQVIAETEKCEVVCSNCHRLRTQDRHAE